MNPTFLLGGELEVRRLGFGAMRVVDDRKEGRHLRAGVSEEVIAEAPHPYPEELVSPRRAASATGFKSASATAGGNICGGRVTRACDG
jgi:hypothetical protein